MIMESTIKWQTGKPKEEGYYLVTFIQIRTVHKIKRKKGKDVVRYIEVEETIVLPDYFNPKYGWEELNEVIAWCKLSDIEPYKLETK